MSKAYLKKIIARSAEDLQIISACCSEGKVKINDIKYLKKNKIFLIYINRIAKEIENSSNKLIPLIVETNDIDVTNNEAVMNGDQSIGYVTSGGFAHFVNKSVAFTFIDQKNIKSENKIQVEINGDLFNCSVIKEPLYDPSGQKMRS